MAYSAVIVSATLTAGYHTFAFTAYDRISIWVKTLPSWVIVTHPSEDPTGTLTPLLSEPAGWFAVRSANVGYGERTHLWVRYMISRAEAHPLSALLVYVRVGFEVEVDGHNWT